MKNSNVSIVVITAIAVCFVLIVALVTGHDIDFAAKCAKNFQLQLNCKRPQMPRELTVEQTSVHR